MKQSGYTLIEVLIMLAITAILASVVLGLIQTATSNGVRIEQAARQASGTLINVTGLRRTIAATRSDYHDGNTAFNGSADQFTALTALPLLSESYSTQVYSLKLIANREKLELIYQDQSGQFTIKHWANADGAFEYLSDNTPELGVFGHIDRPRPKRVWKREWISANEPARFNHASAIPLAIKLNIRSDRGDQVYIFTIESQSAPPLRSVDVTGGSF